MLVSLNVVNRLNHDTARATLDQCRPASARPARGQWQSPPGGPGYLQRSKRKPGLLGCAEEALEVAVEYFTSLAATGYDLAAHFQVIDVDSTTGITLLVQQLGFQLIYDRASAFGGGPASALHVRTPSGRLLQA
ncbi:hypothetical protein [Pseudomonas aeruginosa]|uniref:hypothetical protein n=1 Tax=Pseudomonas aeruginosa TaxID=287 RepID=UPI00137A1AD5|nr:hypothetical protein [Pseudomonas aeruginosa]